MKRLTALLIALSLFLSGCGVFGERIKEPVTFYYVRSEYAEDMTDVIASEEREASGHLGDLSYLLALYLMGPSSEELVSPIPLGTRFASVEQVGSTISLNMKGTANSLTDAEFTLMCACLTLTCLDMTTADEVTITCEERSVTMTRDSLTLTDNSASIAATVATEENG